MPVMEEISKLSKNGCDDALLDYICENYDEIECGSNGGEYEKPKKHNACNKKMVLDYRKSILVCRKCDLCKYYPVYITSYNHSMNPLRRKCVYIRSVNFKVKISSSMVESSLFQMTL